MKIHIVEAYFSDWDSSHFEILGIFTDTNQAIKHEKKWSKFFTLGKQKYQELYNKTNTIEYINDDVNEDDEDYYDFSYCADFISIEIKTYNIGEDITHHRIMNNENQLKQFYIQFNRDEKINKLI